MKKSNQSTQQGFTLLELLAVVLVVGILAVVATPIYTQYAAKARFQEVMSVAESLKVPVAACLQMEGSLTSCNGDVRDIPADDSNSTAASPLTDYNYVNGHEVADSVITVTSIDADGLGGATVTLTPTLKNHVITWSRTCSNTDFCQ